jgi:protein tyrosine phosphatase (PTP) superfamily phosphohydrolase (DUF442 family)
MPYRPVLLALFSVLFLYGSPALMASDPDAPSEVAPIEPVTLGDIRNLHRCGSIWIAGQPSQADFARLKEQGITCVVTFRTPGEVDWDEAAEAAKLGMMFKEIPYGTVDSLTDDIFTETRSLLRMQAKSQPIFLHCGAAVRVAAVWLAYRVLDEKVPLAQAELEAEKMGLRSKALKQRALQYIASQQSK